jgi:cyclic beta-1,2-glucan synthetase
MKSYPHTILEQSMRAVVRCQQEYGKRNQVPWGISEAAFSDRDDNGHYQYQAFGLSDLALKRTLSTEIVVSPYASFLALTVDPFGVLSNLRSMLAMRWLDKFGFYESADYRRTGVDAVQNVEVVRCWMAHHQGMTFAALCNFLTDSSLQRFFHNEPLAAANERLLHEKACKTVSIDFADEPKLPVAGPFERAMEFSQMSAVGKARARFAS